MKNLMVIAIAVCSLLLPTVLDAQHLHTGRWEECSIQLDPSLTQEAFRQFTREAGLLTYFRPLLDARPMGKKHFELSLVQWKTGIDDRDAAWNDTFVHPDTTHWLFEGSGLAFPGLTGRVGVTDRMDVGVYFTKNIKANYGFFGGQVQYSLVNHPEKKWAAATRVSYIQLFGPDDVNLQTYGLDLLVSREFPIYSTWASISPYVSVSGYLSHTHEKSEVVELADETVLGTQASVGAVARLAILRLGVEYNFARVNTMSVKVGVAF